MGSSQSSPEDEIIKEINLEIENIVNTLDKCKSSISTTIFAEDQNHIEELKTKLTASYKTIKTINEFIETLSSKNVDIHNTIKPYQNNLYQVEKEKNEERKAKEKKKLIHKEWLACKLKCTEHDESLLNLKQNLDKKEKVNKELKGIVTNQFKTIMDLQYESRSLQSHLSMKKKAKQEMADKLSVVEECLEKVKRDFETKQEQKCKVILDCKDEIATKTKQLNELKDKLEKIKEQQKTEIARILDESLTECQRKLDIEKTARKAELDKLKAEHEKEVINYKTKINSLKSQLTEIQSTPEQRSQEQLEKLENNSNTHCCDDLKQKLNDKQIKLENEQKKYDKEINRLLNLTNRIKKDLRRSQNKFKHEENLRRKAEKNVSSLEEQVLELEDLQIKLEACQEELETKMRAKQDEVNNHEITAALLKERIKDIRPLEEKLKNCQENLEMEKKAKQQQSRTLQLLQEESKLRKAEVENEILEYKQETRRLCNELNKAKKDLNKVKNDYRQQEMLKKAAESKVFLLEKQTATLNSLQKTLKECRESLDKETKARQDELKKLKVITQYYNNLKEEIEMQQVEHEKMILVYKTEIEVQTTQLSEVKAALNSEAGNTDLLNLSLVDEGNPNGEYTSFKQLRENNKLIQFLKQHLEETSLKINKYKDDVKLNKCFINYQDKSDYEAILQKQKRLLNRLEENVRMTENEKNQSDGKIFLMEESFQLLKQFCKNELEDLKNSLKQIMENTPSENLVEPFIHNTKKNLTATETSETEEAAPTLVVTGREYGINERFCANQRKEMSEFHEQLESLLNKA